MLLYGNSSKDCSGRSEHVILIEDDRERRAEPEERNGVPDVRIDTNEPQDDAGKDQSCSRLPDDADLLFFEYSVVGERHLPELRASVSRHLGFGFAEAAIDDGKVGDRDHDSGAEGQISD